MVVPGMLKVLIEGARDVESLVTMGQQEPYYVLEVGAQRSRSKAAPHGTGTSPIWNTAHKFALSNEVALKVTLKDEITKGVIGEAVIDLTR
jgi:carbamoylphosphate synthase large subunit